MDDNDLNDKLARITLDAQRMSRRWVRGGGIDHEDIAQDVAFYQWKRGDTNAVNFATVRSRSIDALRSLRTRRKLEDDVVRHAVSAKNTPPSDLEGKSADREEVSRFVSQLFSISRLTQTQEVILYQHFAESYSIREISLVWQIGEDEVKRHITNGLDRLRKVLWEIKG